MKHKRFYLNYEAKAYRLQKKETISIVYCLHTCYHPYVSETSSVNIFTRRTKYWYYLDPFSRKFCQ